MADDLDENYVLDDDAGRRGKRTSLHDSTAEEGGGVGGEQRKRKKMNITEALEMRKDEFERPDYCTNELVRLMVAHVDKKLSSVERLELGLQASAEGSTADKLARGLLARTKKSARLSAAEQIGRKFGPKFARYLAEKPKRAGRRARPFAVVLCSSAVRCIELKKELESTCEPLKDKSLQWMYAFAKHKKLAEQVEFVRKHAKPIHLVLATPQRFAQLVAPEAEALDLANLRFCIVDYNHRDCKKKRLVDIPEVKADFIELLFTRLLPLNREKPTLKFYLA